MAGDWLEFKNERETEKQYNKENTGEGIINQGDLRQNA